MSANVPEVLIAQFSNGLISGEIPAGYSIQPAPRRAARGRSGEIFFTALSLQARTSLPPSELDRLSHLMSQVYFETPGSVTAALRAAFTAANAEVLPFSQAPALIGSPSGGLAQLHAVCSVCRDGDLYLGYAGNVLALILRDRGVESYPAAGDTPARALGTSLNIDLHYGHSVLSASSTLLLAASPAAAWSAAVPSGLGNLSLRSIGERMAQQCASQAGAFGALLAKFEPEEAHAEPAPHIRKFPLFTKKKPSSAESRPAGLRPAAPAVSGPGTGKREETRAPSKSQTPAGAAAADWIAPGHPGAGNSVPPEVRPPHATSAGTTRENTGQAASAVQPPASRSEKPAEGGAFSAADKAPDADARFQPAANRVRRTASPAAGGGPPSAGSGLTARQAAGAFGNSIRITITAALDSVRSFLAGILPRGVLQENDRFTLPPSVLLGTAIAIPLLIVAVVAVMYFRKGYEMEFTRLMQEARTEASVASAQTDPLEARAAWQQVFDTLQTAARYGNSEELTALQNQAVRMLDGFDGITPLEFKPAVAGGLEKDTQITVLLAGDRELYALDGIHDRVLRLLLGQGGYQVDDTFLCQSGEYPDITVDSLVDMVWVPDLTVGTQTPSSSRSGAVVALDRQGTLLYCPPGGKAMAGPVAAPTGGWATPSAMEYYNGRLYILDPERNGFWRYGMNGDNGFDQIPTAYFSSGHPAISDVIDFVVASGEVFFLHADGHISRCQYDPLYQPEGVESAGGTLCEDVPYNDTRPGRSVGPRVADALLNRIYYNEPPEPTLFFLDPLGRGAYRFSLALNFISRYRVTIAPEGYEATALAVGADKVLYIAIGNQIYYAQTHTP
jgi:hypothetical protein